MYPFATSSSSSTEYPNKKPLSFPVQCSNRINEEYLTEMHRIIASSNNSNETKPIELSVYRHQSIPIHRFDSDSPTISTYIDNNFKYKCFFLFLFFIFSIDDDEEDELNLNGPLIFVNRSLNLSINSNSIPNKKISYKSRLSEPLGKDQKLNHQSNQCCPINYTRLPHSLRTKNPSFNSPLQSGQIRPILNSTQSIRRHTPQFESVRTPIQKASLELIDCCQT